MWPWSTIRRLREELDVTKARLALTQGDYRLAVRRCALQADQLREAQDALSAARKNDHRDPATGRFVGGKDHA